MKILIINRGYAQGGGAEAAVRGLAELLKAQRHEVAVLTLRNDRGEQGADKGIRVYELNTLSNRLAVNHSKNIIFRFLVFLFDWLNVIAPIKAFLFIKRLKPDVVHTHNLRGMGMLLPLAIRLARWHNPPRPAIAGHPSREGIRWVHTAHDVQLVCPSGVAMYPVLESNNDDRQKVIPWYYRTYARIQRLVWGSPDCVIAPSEFLMKFYREKGFFKNSKFEVVPNIILSNTHPVPQLRDTPPKEGTACDSILFIGALEESKGIRVLIEAVKKLNLKVRVDVVGEGPERSFGSAQDDRLTYHGQLSVGEIQSLFQRALVVVVPSVTYENAPMVIVESLRAGVPVIASRIGGIPEYVQEGVTGWLVEPGSIQELVVSLQAVIEKGVSEEMRKNCVRKTVDLSVQAQAGYVRVLRG